MSRTKPFPIFYLQYEVDLLDIHTHLNICRFGRPEEMGGVVSFLVSDEVIQLFIYISIWWGDGSVWIVSDNFMWHTSFSGLLPNWGDNCTGRRDECQALGCDFTHVIALAKSKTQKMVLYIYKTEDCMGTISENCPDWGIFYWTMAASSKRHHCHHH